jgi:inositol transporter-like SP family MFS transporter
MASFLDIATIQVVGLSVVLLQDDLSLTDTQIGAINAGLTFCFATGALVGGRLGDLFGRKGVYMIDLLVYAVGALLLVFAPNFAVLMAGIVIVGLAMGVDMPTSLALVFEEAKEGQRGSAVVWTNTLWLFSSLITQILGFAVSGLGSLGARMLFGYLFIIAISVWLLRRAMPESTMWVKSKNAGLTRSMATLFKGQSARALAATLLFYALGGLANNTFGQFTAFFVVNLAGSTVRTATILGMVVGVLGVVVSLCFQRYVDTPRRNSLIAVGIVALLVMSLAPAILKFSLLSVIVACLVAPVGGTFAGEGLYKVWSQELFPSATRSTAQGLTMGVGRYFFAAVGYFTPAIATTNPQALMFTMAGLAIVAGVIASYIVKIPVAQEADEITATTITQ